MTKKLTPMKAASAVFAGLLVLGSGMAVAGASLDDSAPDQAEITLVAQPGTEVEDDDADGVKSDDDSDEADDADFEDDADDADDADDDSDDDSDDADDAADEDDEGDDADDDQDEVKAPHPANHGAEVSEAAHGDAVAGSDARNHGATVSAVAKDKVRGPGDDGEGEVPPPATDTPPSVDDDANEDEVDDDDQDEDDEAAEEGDDGHGRKH